MKQNYFLTLLSGEAHRIFPRLAGMNGFAQRVCTAVAGAIMSPLLLYRGLVQFCIPYVEIAVTPRCNLRCVGCANLMPLYTRENNKNGNVDEIIRSIDALLSVSRRISVMTLLGGEPFLHPELYLIVEHALKSGRVGTVKITTNGAIVPGGKNLECLANSRVIVSISEYPTVSRDSLIQALNEKGVRFGINSFDYWEDYGGVNKRGLTREQLANSYARCPSSKCKTVSGGILYTCPRAAHGAILGKIPCVQGEYVDLLNTPSGKLRKEIKALYGRESVTACDYCNPVWERDRIACGQQQ